MIAVRVLALLAAVVALTSTTHALKATSVNNNNNNNNNEKVYHHVLRESGKGWPACDPSVTQWSGLLEINATTQKKYFYWAFGPRSKRADAPVILWMTGGPGCSSSLAMLVENGPCHMNESTGDLYRNPWSWNKDAYVIYIDQPAQVGFSTSTAQGWDSNEAEVSEDMYWFMQDFYQAHPEVAKNDFFIVGESYGGHFAPATAFKIFRRNQQAELRREALRHNMNNNNNKININNKNDSTIHVPLKGLAVGNGLTAPYIQYQYYSELAYNWCIEKTGKPCVSKEEAEAMNASVPGCVALIQGCMRGESFSCLLARITCNTQIIGYELSGRNVYDIRKKCEHPPLCYNFDKVTEFMNREDVQQSLGVPKTQWQSCNMGVNLLFINDWFQTFDNEIASMLDHSGIRVMIYAGDCDFICNWIGNKAWVKQMRWSGKHLFNNATDTPYSIQGKEVAKIRAVSSEASPQQLSFVQVYNAGHMVPMDQPEVISSILQKFVSNKPFN